MNTNKLITIQCAFLMLLSLLFACKNSNTAQSNLQAKVVGPQYLLFPYNAPLVNWKGVEKQNDALKKQFIDHHPANFDNAYNGHMSRDGDITTKLNKLKKDLHIIDLNNDGKDDIIYDGTGGWESNRVMVYLNTGKDFKLIFLDLQYVKKIELKNGKVWRIYTFNPGCCDQYMVFNKMFEFSYAGEPNDFKEIYSTAYYTTTVLPKAFLTKAIRFSVTKDLCSLRTQPLIDTKDTLFLSGATHIGNDVGHIVKGAVGRAIATQKDNKGVEWWFVEMDPKATIKGDILYNELSEGDLSGKMGWINSKEVKTIK